PPGASGGPRLAPGGEPLVYCTPTYSSSTRTVLYIRGLGGREAAPGPGRVRPGGGAYGDVGRARAEGPGGVRLRRYRAGSWRPDHQPQRGGHLLGALRASLSDPDHRG